MIVTSKYTDITAWFFSTLRTLLQQKKTVTIALPGGHSLDGWYATILGDCDLWKGIDMSRLRWCMVDERCVRVDSPDRNDFYVWETFLQPLGIDKKNFLCFGVPEIDALEYSETIGMPDIGIFGLGPDGHIASLFPGHPLLTAQMERYVHIFDAPKMPPERITLTVPSIQKIPHTALFVVGSEKHATFQDFLNPEITSTECPAKFLNPDIILLRFDDSNQYNAA